MIERTLVLIKPDAMRLGLRKPIMEQFTRRAFNITGYRIVRPTAELVEEHYAEKFRTNPELRENVTQYLTSGRIVALIVEGENAIRRVRELIGPNTNAPRGTIRGDFPSDPLHTLVHASDSPKAAKREIAIWFEDFSDTKTVKGEK